MFYSAAMLEEAGIETHEGQWGGTVGINAASLLAAFIPVILIDKYGRRFVCFTRSLSFISLYLIGI